MNKPLSLLTAGLLLTGASSVFAASSTDLTVKGSITPGACTPSLADSGTVNYGTIPAKDLNETSRTKLVDKSIQLTVKCDEAVQFAISAADNRPGTAEEDSPLSFGLGLINGNQKLGSYYLSFRNPTTDHSVDVIHSSNEGASWHSFFDIDYMERNDWIAFDDPTVGGRTPAFLQNLTVDIRLLTQIAPANTLTLTSEVQLDGSATLQIVYP